MKLLHERTHHWSPGPRGHWTNTARVELYGSQSGTHGVVVLIDGPFNTGTSTINDAENLTRSLQPLMRSLLPDAHLRLLDAQTHPRRGTEYSWVTFRDPLQLRAPEWTYVSPAEVRALIGDSRWRARQGRVPHHGDASPTR